MSLYNYFVVNVDGDPDPVTVFQSDDEILEKYSTMQLLLKDQIDGKGAFSVLTAPLYRDRFFHAPFIAFWQSWKDGGGDLVLHPEEDLYGPPPGKHGEDSSYDDINHMTPIILDKADFMRRAALDFAAYRGGSHGMTPKIVSVLKTASIGIDLSCAPGISWPARAAAWPNAPLSAYYMSSTCCEKLAELNDRNPIFEIPFAWDGKAPSTAKRFVVGDNYIINEFSSFAAMCKVWDAIVNRSHATGKPQIVSMICHTFSMLDERFRSQLAKTLEYMTSNNGVSVTPSEAKRIFDKGF